MWFVKVNSFGLDFKINFLLMKFWFGFSASNFLITYDNAKACAVIEAATSTANNKHQASGNKRLDNNLSDDYDQVKRKD